MTPKRRSFLALSFSCLCIPKHLLINNNLNLSFYYFIFVQFLNIKLTDISLTDPDKYPHMVRPINEVMIDFINTSCLSEICRSSNQFFWLASKYLTII